MAIQYKVQDVRFLLIRFHAQLLVEVFISKVSFKKYYDIKKSSSWKEGSFLVDSDAFYIKLAKK